MSNPKPKKQLRTGGLTGPKTGKTQNLTTGKAKRSKKMNNPLIASEKQLLTYRIPECVSHYFNALCDPFTAPPGACLPCDLFPLPSLKQRVFARGGFNLGTTGYGFIAATPTITNDSAIVQYSTSTSVANEATLFSAYTNIFNGICVMNTITSAQINPGNQVAARIVSFGLRVKYVGSLANRNGVISCMEDPDGVDTRRFSWSTLGSNPYSSLTRVGPDAWDCQICYSGPVRPQDFEFTNSIYPNSTNAPLIIALKGAAGDEYEFEYYQHSEIIGSLVPGKSPSHSEAQLFGKVVETVKNETAKKPLMPAQKESLWDSFKRSVAESLPMLYQAGKGAAQLLIGDYAGGFSSVSQAIMSSGAQNLVFPAGGSRERQQTLLLK